MKKQTDKKFSISDLRPEQGMQISGARPRTAEAEEMIGKLNALKVNESYTMPRIVEKIYASAKTTLQRSSKKVFIYRTLDKYSFRCWRIADGTVLKTKRK